MHLAQIIQYVEHVLIDLHGLATLYLCIEIGLCWPLKQLRPIVLQNLHQLVFDADDVRL